MNQEINLRYTSHSICFVKFKNERLRYIQPVFLYFLTFMPGSAQSAQSSLTRTSTVMRENFSDGINNNNNST